MQDIPEPAVLDPDRPRLRGDVAAASDPQAALESLDAALHDVCAYARQLWEHVALARRHLVDSLPTGSLDDDVDGLLTAPRGPDDDEGWRRWADAHAALTSVLAGPRGDSGYGRHEAAQLEAQHRGPLMASDRVREIAAVARDRRRRVAGQLAPLFSTTVEDDLERLDPDDPTPTVRPAPGDDTGPRPATRARGGDPALLALVALLGVALGAAGRRRVG